MLGHQPDAAADLRPLDGRGALVIDVADVSPQVSGEGLRLLEARLPGLHLTLVGPAETLAVAPPELPSVVAQPLARADEPARVVRRSMRSSVRVAARRARETGAAFVSLADASVAFAAADFTFPRLPGLTRSVWGRLAWFGRQQRLVVDVSGEPSSGDELVQTGLCAVALAGTRPVLGYLAPPHADGEPVEVLTELVAKTGGMVRPMSAPEVLDGDGSAPVDAVVTDGQLGWLVGELLAAQAASDGRTAPHVLLGLDAVVVAGSVVEPRQLVDVLADAVRLAEARVPATVAAAGAALTSYRRSRAGLVG